MASNDTNNTNAYQNTENIVVSQQQSQLIHPSTQSTTAECKATEGNSLNSPLTQPQQISTPSMFDNSVLAETQRQNSGVKRPATTEFGKGNKENSSRPQKLPYNPKISTTTVELEETGGSETSTSADDVSSSLANSSRSTAKGRPAKKSNSEPLHNVPPPRTSTEDDQKPLAQNSAELSLNNSINMGIPMYYSTPLAPATTSRATDGRGTEKPHQQDLQFMPAGGSNPNNSGFSIGYSPQLSHMGMPSAVPYATWSFAPGAGNMQATPFPSTMTMAVPMSAMQPMPYGFHQQQAQPWMYGSPQAFLFGQQNISGSSQDSGIAPGNISGSDVMAKDNSGGSIIEGITDGTDENAGQVDVKSKPEQDLLLNRVREIRRMLKPFIRRQIETDPNTNAQRETEVDLERELFTKRLVPGRLVPLGLSRKYEIYLAEIFRRIKMPENLNTSALCGILRLAKGANGGKEFRELLEKLGLVILSGRRKSARPTVFSVLCEGEALQLAEDFSYLTQHFFPTGAVATAMNKKAMPSQHRTQENVAQRLNAIQMTKDMLAEYTKLIEDGIQEETQPLSGEQDIVQQNSPLDTEFRDSMICFGRITHCFGNRMFLTAYRSFLQVLEDCERELVNNNSQSADVKRPMINLGGAYTPQMFTNGAMAMNPKPF